MASTGQKPLKECRQGERLQREFEVDAVGLQPLTSQGHIAEFTTGIQSCENGVNIAENGIPCRTGGTPFVIGIFGGARLDDLHRPALACATQGPQTE